MSQTMEKTNLQEHLLNILKKAYVAGTQQEMTRDELLKQITKDLQHLTTYMQTDK